MAHRIMAVVASGTETRATAPVLRELINRGEVTVETFVPGIGSVYMDQSRSELERTGLHYRTIGRNAPLNVKRLLDDCRPELVILADDSSRLNLRIVREAKSRRIPVMLIQEGATAITAENPVKKSLKHIFQQWQRVVFALRLLAANGGLTEIPRLAVTTALGRQREAPAYGYGGVDVFCVPDSRVAATLRENGCTAGAILPTGIPGFMTLYAPQPVAYDATIYTGPHDLAGHMTRAEKLAIYTDIINTIRDVNPDAKVACKLHPTESTDDYADLPPVEFEPDLEKAVAGSRIGISIGSSVLCQVFAQGHTAVAYCPDRFSFPDNASSLYCRQLGLYAGSTEELRGILAGALSGNGNGKARELAEELQHNSKDPEVRIADAAMKLLEGAPL